MVIGIFGGGQLGMMMAQEAINLGHQVIGLDPNPKCPLSYYATEMITAQYSDKKAFEELVKKTDVITYEFENVDLNFVKEYEYMIPQKKEALLKSKNRIIEKEYAKNLGIPTPSFTKYSSKKEIQIPSVIKTTTGGYDGKGQFYIRSKHDIDHLELSIENEYIIEAFLSFDNEISVVATRDQFGNIATYPIPINTHRNGILFTSEIYNQFNVEIIEKAKTYSTKLINELDYVGTLAIEYFIIGNNVVFNEFAPRPHNSGHYTIEGASISQFKNHILAITGEKVIDPKLLQPTIMINVLGQDMAFIDRANELEETYIHMYNKDIAKTDRKMGHITILGNSVQEVKEKLSFITKESL